MFQLEELVASLPQYNIAPGSDIFAVRGIVLREEESRQGSPSETSGFEREAAMLRWGFVPSWANNPKVGFKMINARAETVHKKAAFKDSLAKQRCLIPADGFFEWKRSRASSTGKEPYFIHMKNREPFAFAGLWSQWQSPDALATLETCSIITTEANAIVKPIHDRMPVILPKEEFDTWLNPSVQTLEEIIPLLSPFEAAEMEAYRVSDYVSNTKNKGEECIKPFKEKFKQTTLF